VKSGTVAYGTVEDEENTFISLEDKTLALPREILINDKG
jgi:hypothetical protein